MCQKRIHRSSRQHHVAARPATRRELRSNAALDRFESHVDVLPGVERVDREAFPVFVQVNVSGESTKSGFAPTELEDALDRLGELARLDVVGLMTMAPVSESPEHTRAVFRSLRKLRDEMRDRGYLRGIGLSMGMSSDFEVAIEEGATVVRVGSALYAGIRD